MGERSPRDFYLLWAGHTISCLGEATAALGQPLVVLDATRSVTQVGLTAAVFGVGNLLSILVAGHIVDRFDRRKLMILCDVIRAVLFGLVVACWLTVGPVMPLFLGVVLIDAALGSLWSVAYVSLIPVLVAPKNLVRANGRLEASRQLSLVLGPIVAGVVASRLHPIAAIAVNAASLAASGFATAFIRPARDQARPPAPSAEHDREVLVGLRFILRQPDLRLFALVLPGVVMVVEGYREILIFHFKDNLLLTDVTIGWVLAGAGFTGLLAAWSAPRLQSRLGTMVAFMMSTLAQTAAIGLMGLGFGPAVLAVGAAGFANVVRMVVEQSVFHLLTPEAVRGRVTATLWVLCQAPRPLFVALATAAVPRFGAPLVLGAMSGIGVLLSLGSFVVGRRFTIGAGAAERGVTQRTGD